MALKNLYVIIIFPPYFSCWETWKNRFKQDIIEGYYINVINVRETWLRSSPVCLDGYGTKKQKVGRCRPAVSNETILANRQELFLTKVAPVQNTADTFDTIGLLINIAHLNVYFTLASIYFFVNKLIFSNV